jgi:hypothetical protein
MKNTLIAGDAAMEYCKSRDFVKNECGAYIYVSQNGVEFINLPRVMAEFVDWLIENGKL